MTGPRPLSWVADLQPAVHGAVNTAPAPAGDRERGRILDFSANGNVIGPPTGALRAVAEVDVTLHPDRSCTALREAIAEQHGLSPDRVVAGNGTTEIIWAIARAFLGPGDATLVPEPTYGEYAVACCIVGARVNRVDAWVPGPGGERAAARLAAALERSGARVVWLCHPNNPTGRAVEPSLLSQLLPLAPETLFVVDEAYLTLAEGIPSHIPLIGTGQVMILRSLTKDCALAGVRVGYGLADGLIADAIRSCIPPWSVSSLAQAAGLAALGDSAHLERARAAVTRSRDHLISGLRRLGLHPFPSAANFVLVPVGEAGAVAERLLDRGLGVRDCTSFGLPHCIRIGVRPIADQDQLLAALGQVVPDASLAS